NAGHLEGELLAFYNQSARAIWNQGTANINKLLLKDLNLAPRRSQAILSYGIVGAATLTIRDSHFENVTNLDTRATLWALAVEHSASITLEGCLTDINNIPTLSLETSGGTVTLPDPVVECDADFIYEFPRQLLPRPPGDDEKGAAGTGGAAPVFLPTTCETLPASIMVSRRHPDTRCQQVSGAGIGVAALVEGARAAVDVWNVVAAGTQVCFAATGGSIQFLDAATSPRAQSQLAACSREGRTCATIDRPGTLVLMPGPMPGVCAAAAQTPTAAAASESSQSQSLSDCMVTTTDILNLREGPGGAVTGMVPYDVTLTAFTREGGWYEVDYHGARGWISGDYVAPQGDCG
ncbi:MAG: SH3 domain-containing protein, partial [Anaerolineaceae bacterium]|nr:SH3 domain-containing protein [Anaerolineaceae bacterium]